jgi:hypothetical protein
MYVYMIRFLQLTDGGMLNSMRYVMSADRLPPAQYVCLEGIMVQSALILVKHLQAEASQWVEDPVLGLATWNQDKWCQYWSRWLSIPFCEHTNLLISSESQWLKATVHLTFMMETE